MSRSITCNVIATEAAAAIFGLLAPLRMRSTVNLAPYHIMASSIKLYLCNLSKEISSPLERHAFEHPIIELYWLL